MSRMCKAVNTTAHRSGFTLLITMSEKHLEKCMEMFEEENYTVLIGYIKTEEAKGKHGKSAVIQGRRTGSKRVCGGGQTFDCVL